MLLSLSDTQGASISVLLLETRFVTCPVGSRICVVCYERVCCWNHGSADRVRLRSLQGGHHLTGLQLCLFCWSLLSCASLTSCGRVGSKLGIVVTDISSALFALRNFALEFQAICRRRSFELRRVLSSLRRHAPKHSAIRVINASGGASSSNITIHYEIMKA